MVVARSVARCEGRSLGSGFPAFGKFGQLIDLRIIRRHKNPLYPPRLSRKPDCPLDDGFTFDANDNIARYRLGTATGGDDCRQALTADHATNSLLSALIGDELLSIHAFTAEDSSDFLPGFAVAIYRLHRVSSMLQLLLYCPTDRSGLVSCVEDVASG